MSNNCMEEQGDIAREIEKFIIRQPPKGEKDDYDSENSSARQYLAGKPLLPRL